MPPSRPPDPPEVLARVQECMVVVDMLAGQLRSQLGPRVERNDLISYGREGLLTAARSFDPERGVPFRRWANIKIRGAMIDGVRQIVDLPRTLYRRLRAIEAANQVQESMMEEDGAAPPPDAKAADTRLDAYLATMATAMAMGMTVPLDSPAADAVKDESLSPEELYAREEVLAAIRASIASRPDAERTLLERHYLDGVTFETAAAELGLSKSWASRLHSRAIEGVSKEMRRSRIKI